MEIENQPSLENFILRKKEMTKLRLQKLHICLKVTKMGTE